MNTERCTLGDAMVTGWPHMSNPADDTFFFILGISLTLLALNTGLMLYFVFRYSRKRHPKAEEVEENVTLEVLWTVIPTILVLAMFYIGWKGFVYMRTAPADAMVVHVTARQWSWTFDYANGKETNVLKVPVRKPIKLLITSADVLHSLFIPAFHIKEDCVPGMQTHLWFQPDELGSYDLFCTEYCGVGHSSMITKVDVMTQKDFDDWYTGKKEAKRGAETAGTKAGAKPSEKEEGLAHEGKELFTTKGCVACHTTDGTPKIGPTLKGVYGHTVTVETGGKERQVTADDAYIRRSLEDPQADVVKGFQPIMPSQKGQLTDKQVQAIIEYLKTL